MRKIPMRRCVVTNERYPKNELIRVVKTPEGEIRIDPTGKLNGHGAYLKKDAAVIRTARQKKILDRCLEAAVSPELYDQLEQLAG
jgi:predicted RNA-binding protein YlxR (DUF448 family)